MAYIYSTLSSDNEYRVYKKGGADMNIVAGKVVVKGKANIANKNIITPRGVATMVTADELKLLEENESFKRHKERGFISVSTKQETADKVANDMSKKDKSAPKTKEDFGIGKVTTNKE